MEKLYQQIWIGIWPGRMAYLLLKNAEIKEVMKQIERWYDVEVKYEGQVSKGSITGKMSRKWKLSEMMLTINQLGFTTKLEGKKPYCISIINPLL